VVVASVSDWASSGPRYPKGGTAYRSAVRCAGHEITLLSFAGRCRASRSNSHLTQAAGLGKPIGLLARPIQERVPVYLGAMGPKAVAQCFQIADGWLPFPVGLDLLSEQKRPVDRPFDASPAFAARGRRYH
jgi:hypothetical protein